jgi:hypothetical protein
MAIRIYVNDAYGLLTIYLPRNLLTASSQQNSLETICGIIAACLPTIKPVLQGLVSKAGSLLSYVTSKSHLDSLSKSHSGYPLQELPRKELHGFSSTSNLRNTKDIQETMSNHIEDIHEVYPASPRIMVTTKIALATEVRKSSSF